MLRATVPQLGRCITRCSRRSTVYNPGLVGEIQEQEPTYRPPADMSPFATRPASVNYYGSKEFLSLVHGDSTIPLVRESLGVLWKRQVAKYGGKQFVVSLEQNKKLSWKELDVMAEALARGLKKFGYRRGDVIAVWLPNSIEWLTLQIACAKSGIIMSSLCTNYARREVLYALSLPLTKGIIIDNTPRCLEVIHELLPSLSEGECKSNILPQLKHVFTVSEEKHTGIEKFSDLFVDGITSEQNLTLSSRDFMSVFFTSAATAVPKGAMHYHYGLVNGGIISARRFNITDEDTLCIPVPLYHAFGGIFGNLAAIASGSKIVYPSKEFHPETVLAAIESEKCTTLYGTDTMYDALLETPNLDTYKIPSLQKGILSGNITMPSKIEDFTSRLKFSEFTNAYILSECSGVTFLNKTLDKNEPTIGLVQDHFEAKIVDTDNQVLPTGAPGELCVRGYGLMGEYLGDTTRSGKTIDDQGGWLHTGDVGIMNNNGEIRIIGKVAETINRGGVSVYPKETEDVMVNHPAVDKAVLSSFPDPKYGEEICAWVVLKPNATLREQELQRFCAKFVDHDQIPRRVQFVKNLPTSAHGKYQKHFLREYWKKLMEE